MIHVAEPKARSFHRRKDGNTIGGATLGGEVRPLQESTVFRWGREICILAALWCTVCALQWHDGAFSSEFGEHADEAA